MKYYNGKVYIKKVSGNTFSKISEVRDIPRKISRKMQEIRDVFWVKTQFTARKSSFYNCKVQEDQRKLQVNFGEVFKTPKIREKFPRKFPENFPENSRKTSVVFLYKYSFTARKSRFLLL